MGEGQEKAEVEVGKMRKNTGRSDMWLADCQFLCITCLLKFKKINRIYCFKRGSQLPRPVNDGCYELVRTMCIP